MTKIKFYAVKVGYKPGINTSWKTAFDQVSVFSSVEFKSFKSRKPKRFISERDDEDPTRKADHDV